MADSGSFTLLGGTKPLIAWATLTAAKRIESENHTQREQKKQDTFASPTVQKLLHERIEFIQIMLGNVCKKQGCKKRVGFWTLKFDNEDYHYTKDVQRTY